MFIKNTLQRAAIYFGIFIKNTVQRAAIYFEIFIKNTVQRASVTVKSNLFINKSENVQRYVERKEETKYLASLHSMVFICGCY